MLVMKNFIKSTFILLGAVTFLILNLEVGIHNQKENVSINGIEVAVTTQLANAFKIPEEIYCYEMNGCKGAGSCEAGGEKNEFQCQLLCNSGTVIFCPDDDSDEPIEN
jgi:hypothetical protein